MKKVRCLYRVSTVKQLDKNDIPMQRIECQKFIEYHPDWMFDKEYIEKPKKWDTNGIKKFMFAFGIISTIYTGLFTAS